MAHGVPKIIMLAARGLSIFGSLCVISSKKTTEAQRHGKTKGYSYALGIYLILIGFGAPAGCQWKTGFLPNLMRGNSSAMAFTRSGKAIVASQWTVT
jgi:hypothetical protein